VGGAVTIVAVGRAVMVVGRGAVTAGGRGLVMTGWVTGGSVGGGGLEGVWEGGLGRGEGRGGGMGVAVGGGGGEGR
jgi:hypothetical protein